MEFYWKCGLVQLNPILFNVTQRCFRFRRIRTSGLAGAWALGRWLAYLSPFGDGDLPGTHEVALTLTRSLPVLETMGDLTTVIKFEVGGITT